MGRIRTQEQNKKILEMVEARLVGCTYQEIADRYGLSKQYVHRLIESFAENECNIRKSPLDKCIYPNIKKWMLDSDITMVKLLKICGLSETNTNAIKMRLCGERSFKIPEIKAILKKSGRTFEYMFTEKAVDDESK